MEEQLASLSSDEPEPLVGNDFLDRPLRHDATPAQK
jgi:hypothetical protein